MSTNATKTNSLFIKPFWLFLIIIFIIRYYSSLPNFKEGDHVRITTTISTEPVRYPNSQYFRSHGLKIYLDPFPEVNYGDRVIVEGFVDGDKLSQAKLTNYLASTNPLSSLRNKLLSVYQQSLPLPHSALVAGVVLGSKQNISNDFWEKLKISGTAHVVVASGMNVTLVAMFLIDSLVHIINRKRAVIIAITGIWLYSALSGFDAPIVRAAIMGTIAFSAQALGKLYLAWNSLILSALVMLIFKPAWVGDLGFILSFIATASLMLFYPRINAALKKIPNFLREDLSTSLAAQIGVAPILFLTFGQFNPLSPFINALILWTIPPVTIFGAIAGIIGLLSPFLAHLILLLIYPFTWWFISIINLFT